jgi:uncharacterized membrane protein YoaK (UPF0700 family)
MFELLLDIRDLLIEQKKQKWREDMISTSEALVLGAVLAGLLVSLIGIVSMIFIALYLFQGDAVSGDEDSFPRKIS